jgi:hypothetical protein
LCFFKNKIRAAPIGIRCARRPLHCGIFSPSMSAPRHQRPGLSKPDDGPCALRPRRRTFGQSHFMRTRPVAGDRDKLATRAKRIEEAWIICPPRYPRRLKLDETRGRDHNPCDEGGEAREQQQIMQDEGHRKSSMQRRGPARISRPERGGDC